MYFDVDVKDFISKNNKSEKKKKKKKKSANLNSTEQILKRRQMAFNYGQAIRRRTFGCY